MRARSTSSTTPAFPTARTGSSRTSSTSSAATSKAGSSSTGTCCSAYRRRPQMGIRCSERFSRRRCRGAAFHTTPTLVGSAAPSQGGTHGRPKHAEGADRDRAGTDSRSGSSARPHAADHAYESGDHRFRSDEPFAGLDQVFRRLELLVLRPVGRPGMFRVDPPTTSFTHPALWPGTTYAFSVVTVDANGNRSGSSNTVRYTTPADVTPPSPPPVLSATAVYPMRISLTWTASKDNATQVYYTLL